MASRWKDIGYQLGLSDGEIQAIKKDQQGDSFECCRSVMLSWLEKGGTKDYPVKWDSILELLNDCELFDLAKKLEEML